MNQFWKRTYFLWLALLLGLGLRLVLWGNIPRTGLISDEGEYLSAAAWLVEGRGFDWYQGYLWTRAPIYPLFVAAHHWLFGPTSTALYVSQIILSLLQIVFVYMLAGRLSRDLRIRGAAAILTALYLPLALYTQIALSETLYITLLLAGFLALDATRRAGVGGQGSGVRGQGSGEGENGRVARRDTTSCVSPERGRQQTADTRPGDQEGRDEEPGELGDESALLTYYPGPAQRPGNRSTIGMALLAGLLFGLATLTRSLTLGFLALVVVWMFKTQNSKLKTQNLHNRSTLIFILATLLVILPWTAYNSWLYGGPVLVDTSGSYNVLLGARTAADGKRSDAQVRDYVLGLLGQRQSAPVTNSCKPYPGQLMSQAARQSAMTGEGLCLIAAHPVAFVQKSLAELVDLFQINYTGAERFTNGFSTGRLPPWYVLMLFVLDDTLYVLSLPLAVLGWAVVRGQGSGRVGEWETADKETGRPGGQEWRVGELESWGAEGGKAKAKAFSMQDLVYTLTKRMLWPWTHNSQTSSLPGLLSLWLLYNIMVAPLLFAINRFRVPLMPIVFLFVPFGCIWLWNVLKSQQKGGRKMWMGLNSILALLLFLIAATPYAYLEPRKEGEDSRWASYLGPYPSSLDITGKALQARSRYVADQQFELALSQGDFAEAKALLQSGAAGDELRRLGPVLLAARQGDIPAAFRQLPDTSQVDVEKDVSAGVLRGDLLRTQGKTDAALAQLSVRYIDDANPLEWAWIWLKPMPSRSINLGGSLDIGYVRGCYSGEGDPAAGGNFRWCTDGAQLRFPGTGQSAPQTLVLRVDARAWKLRATRASELSVWLGDQLLGQAALNMDSVSELRFNVPPTLAGTELVFTLHSATFVPDAARYNSQQGSDVVGQVQYLGVRIDRAELVQ